MWDRRGGILTDDDTPGGIGGGKSILTERGQIIRRDKDQFPSSPVLTGLFGWYRVDLISANDGDSITSIDDQSGLSNTLGKQGTGALQYFIEQLNGYPILRATESGGDLAGLVRNSVTNLPAGPVARGGSLTGVTQVWVYRRRYDAGFPSHYTALINFINHIGAVLSNATAVTTTFSADGAAGLVELIDDWQILSLVQDNATNAVDLRTNGQTATGTAGGAIIGDAMGLIPGIFEFAESLWYRVPLSSDDLNSTRLYLANKYAISITV